MFMYVCVSCGVLSSVDFFCVRLVLIDLLSHLLFVRIISINLSSSSSFSLSSLSYGVLHGYGCEREDRVHALEIG